MNTMIYKTKGTCSTEIHIELDGDILKSVQFIGGCNGNLKGITALVTGMNVNDVITKLDGIECRTRGTSCPDQLAKALKEAINA